MVAVIKTFVIERAEWRDSQVFKVLCTLLFGNKECLEARLLNGNSKTC